MYVRPALLSLLVLPVSFTVNAATPTLTLENNEWNQVSIPADPSGQTLASLFGDDLDMDLHDDKWIVWSHDAASNQYSKVGVNDPLQSGEGLWFIQTSGGEVVLTLPDSLVNTAGVNDPECSGADGCLTIPLVTQNDRATWTMLGVGLNQAVTQNDFTFVSDRAPVCVTGCSIAQANNLELSSPTLYWYNPGTSTYNDLSDNSALEPWQGAWFATTASSSTNVDNERLLITVPAQCNSSDCGSVIVGNTRTKWQPLIIDVLGPTASETDTNPNPFLDIRLDITLTSPSGESVVVPGYFAGDGQGWGTGNTWRVRFAPDQAGRWSYSVSFRQGDALAVMDESTTGSPLLADSAQGSFTVVEQSSGAPGLLAGGRLEYVGEHYLKQRDGRYWIKTGIDSPENFFAYAGFDNTEDQPGGAGTNGLQDGLHRYPTHVADWAPGDPNFASVDTGVDAKGIIGAVNYLSSQEVNSIYFLPMNLGGDGRDTYPFLGPSGSDYDNTHYDVSKLYQWNVVLDHMQRKGIAAHIVLAETESGNTNWFDNGQLGDTRKLYYRELVARFSYLNGLKWNLSEESRYGTEKHIQFASFLRSLDWADHPVTVHTNRDSPGRTYDELLGDPNFDATSIQFSPGLANLYVELWREQSANAGRKWVVDMDEVAPAGTGLSDTNADELRSEVLYPTLFSGGNIEWYFGYHNLPLGGDMRTENFRTREAMFGFMRYARRFMEQHLPYAFMQPNDGALSGGQSGDQVFEKTGEVYALYLLNGAAGRTLSVADGNYDVRWFDPRTGQFVGNAAAVSGSQIALSAAPNSADEDWVVLLERQ